VEPPRFLAGLPRQGTLPGRK